MFLRSVVQMPVFNVASPMAVDVHYGSTDLRLSDHKAALHCRAHEFDTVLSDLCCGKRKTRSCILDAHPCLSSVVCSGIRGPARNGAHAPAYAALRVPGLALPLGELFVRNKAFHRYPSGTDGFSHTLLLWLYAADFARDTRGFGGGSAAFRACQCAFRRLRPSLSCGLRCAPAKGGFTTA